MGMMRANRNDGGYIPTVQDLNKEYQEGLPDGRPMSFGGVNTKQQFAAPTGSYGNGPNKGALKFGGATEHNDVVNGGRPNEFPMDFSDASLGRRQDKVNGQDTLDTQDTQEKNKPAPIIATTIEWSDSVETEGGVSEEEISKVKPDEFKKKVEENGGDSKFAKQVADIFGGANNLKGLLARLESGIEEEQNKRKKARLLAFGLSLMGGSSMAQAMQAANATPFYDDEELKQLLDERYNLKDKLQKAYLKSEGIDFDEKKSDKLFEGSYKGADGKTYTKLQVARPDGAIFIDSDGQAKPKGVSVTKLGANDGQLSKYSIEKIDKNVEERHKVERDLDRIRGIKESEPVGGWRWSGIFSKGAEGFKQFMGTQNITSDWRLGIQDLIKQKALERLPKGSSSEQDRKWAEKTQINGFANADAINRYLDIAERRAIYAMKYYDSQSEWLGNPENKSLHGWEAPLADTAKDPDKGEGENTVVSGLSGPSESNDIIDDFREVS